MPFLLPATVQFNSNGHLSNRVATQGGSQAWFAQPAKTPQPVAELDFPREVCPMAVLHLLGFATTPGVATQAGFTQAWAWAFVRYFWAFTSTNGDLALSSEAASLRNHHCAALSEYLGIGFALEAAVHLARQRFSDATVICVDAEEALGQASAGGHITPIGNKLRPDYLVLAFKRNKVVGLWTLECKGSKSASGEITRLAKATRQVESLQIHGGGPPSGLVCSTVANSKGITVSMLDPEGDKNWLGAFGDGQATEVATSESADLVSDPAALRLDALALDSARLLTWSGAYESARSIAPLRNSNTVRYENREAQTVQVGGIPYSGVQSSFPTAEGVVEVFHGVEAGLRDSLIDLRNAPDRSALVDIRAGSTGAAVLPVDPGEDEATWIDGSGAITRFVIQR
jgi:hypothetical protein